MGIGASGIAALASALDLGSTTGILATMIGLAVGIDYALFIVSRYRAELAEGPRPRGGRRAGRRHRRIRRRLRRPHRGHRPRRPGRRQHPDPHQDGRRGGAAVALAVLIALTLIPALLGYAGPVRPRPQGPRRPGGRRSRPRGADLTKDSADGGAKPNAGTRWARFVLRRPIAVLLVGVFGLGALAVPAASLELGLPDDGAQPTSTTQRRAYDLLSEGFGPGSNGPLMVVVDGGQAAADKAAQQIRGLDGVAAVTPATLNEARDTAVVTVVPKDRPSSEATEELVRDIRETTGDSVLVTGQTAMNIDFSQKMNDALLPYLALVVGLAFLLLMVVFRSVLVPLKAALGFLLSVVAALGAVVAVFQWGWLGGLFGVEQTGPIMSMMPIFMVGVVFGLAMDYEVFLVTRMREAYVHGERPGEAIVTGFRHGARVVTAAAVIMIAVFAGFIGSSEQMVKMIGFGLATRGPLRRVRGPHGDRPSGARPPRPQGVAAAALAGPRPAERGRRRRGPAQGAGRRRPVRRGARGGPPADPRLSGPHGPLRPPRPGGPHPSARRDRGPAPARRPRPPADRGRRAARVRRVLAGRLTAVSGSGPVV